MSDLKSKMSAVTTLLVSKGDEVTFDDLIRSLVILLGLWHRSQDSDLPMVEAFYVENMQELKTWINSILDVLYTRYDYTVHFDDSGVDYGWQFDEL